MDRVRKRERPGLLIQGNFLPREQAGGLQILIKVLGIFLGIAVVVSMVVYGLTVHVEAGINQMGQKTRVVSEVNKELQVNLNRLQSYQNVEQAAEQVPNLHLSDETIEVHGACHRALPLPPVRQGEWPRVQGY